MSAIPHPILMAIHKHDCTAPTFQQITALSTPVKKVFRCVRCDIRVRVEPLLSYAAAEAQAHDISDTLIAIGEPIIATTIRHF